MRNQHNLARKACSLPRPAPSGAVHGPALFTDHPITSPQARTSFPGGRGRIAVLGRGERLALDLARLVAVGLSSLDSVGPLKVLILLRYNSHSIKVTLLKYIFTELCNHPHYSRIFLSPHKETCYPLVSSPGCN